MEPSHRKSAVPLADLMPRVLPWVVYIQSALTQDGEPNYKSNFD